MSCPGGHELPHTTQRGSCTPLRCAETGSKAPFTDVVAAKKRAPAREERAIKPVKEADEGFEEADVHFQLRARKLGLPLAMDGDASEAWATKRLDELRAVAVADMEWDLKYGNEQQRREARRDLLDATGMRKKEGGGNIVPSMTIVFGSDMQAPEWLKRAATQQITEGAVVKKDDKS